MFSIQETAASLGSALTSLLYRVARIARDPSRVTTFAPQSQAQVWLLIAACAAIASASSSLASRSIPMAVMFHRGPLVLFENRSELERYRSTLAFSGVGLAAEAIVLIEGILILTIAAWLVVSRPVRSAQGFYRLFSAAASLICVASLWQSLGDSLAAPNSLREASGWSFWVVLLLGLGCFLLSVATCAAGAFGIGHRNIRRGGVLLMAWLTIYVCSAVVMPSWREMLTHEADVARLGIVAEATQLRSAGRAVEIRELLKLVPEDRRGDLSVRIVEFVAAGAELDESGKLLKQRMAKRDPIAAEVEGLEASIRRFATTVDAFRSDFTDVAAIQILTADVAATLGDCGTARIAYRTALSNRTAPLFELRRAALRLQCLNRNPIIHDTPSINSFLRKTDPESAEGQLRAFIDITEFWNLKERRQVFFSRGESASSLTVEQILGTDETLDLWPLATVCACEARKGIISPHKH